MAGRTIEKLAGDRGLEPHLPERFDPAAYFAGTMSVIAEGYRAV